MKKSSFLACITIVLCTALAALAVDKLTIAPLPQQTDGVSVTTTAAEKLGFHDATPVVQRANASQVAVSTNALSVNATYSQAEVTAIATRASALTTLVNELRAALVEKGLIKGNTNE
jgi:hypothetical protein